MDKKPNFFIVGAPKAGTTSLYFYLEEHPEVYMSPIKETNYFSQAEIRQQELYYNELLISSSAEYERQFGGVTNEKAIGEASVSYLFYPSVPEKIKAFNPDAKIIVVLRNPVDRGYSHYLMDKRLGLVKFSLEEITNKSNDNQALNLFYQQYIGLGCYYDQVKRYLDTFGQDRVKIFLYEDIIKDINGVVKQTYNFLNVDDEYIAATDQKHNAFMAPKNALVEKLYTIKAFRTMSKRLMGDNLQKTIKNLFFEKEKKPVLSQSLKDQMLAIFKNDTIKTAQLLDRDLNSWLQ